MRFQSVVRIITDGHNRPAVGRIAEHVAQRQFKMRRVERYGIVDMDIRKNLKAVQTVTHGRRIVKGRIRYLAGGKILRLGIAGFDISVKMRRLRRDHGTRSQRIGILIIFQRRRSQTRISLQFSRGCSQIQLIAD